MATNNVKVLHIVPVELSVNDMTFKEGMKLSNEATLAAYLKCLFQNDLETECMLTVPEIISTWNVTKQSTGYSDQELENAVIDALKARQAGEGDDDIPLTDKVSAANRIALAASYGAKLGEDGNQTIAEFIAARKTVKIGPVAMLFVVRAHWTSEDIDAMPMPWSKPEGKNVVVDKSNVKFDIYRTDVSGETKRGSWYEDTILTLTTPDKLHEEIDRINKLSDQDKTADHMAYKGTSKSDLNSATNLLRRAVMLDKVLRYIDTFDELEYTIRMKTVIDPVTKAKTQVPATDKADYPILLWGKGDPGKYINLTLNQLMKAFDPATNKQGVPLEPTISRLEAAKAAGGLLEHFKAYVLPKKERGKNNFPPIETSDKFLAAMFRQGIYLESSGVDKLIRELSLPGAVGVTNGIIFHDVVKVLNPIWMARRHIWESYDAKERAEALKESEKEQAKKDAA